MASLTFAKRRRRLSRSVTSVEFTNTLSKKASTGARRAASAFMAPAKSSAASAGAMRLLSALRAPVDAFFDKVLVNSQIPEERENRLRLLAKVRDAMGQVADFSQVTG